MKPPTINLARRPFRNNTLYYGVFGSCAILLLAATGYNAREFTERGAQLQALREQVVQRSAAYQALFEEVERMKKDIAAVNLASLDSKSGFANGLILARFFSWSSLFDRMEAIIPDDVKVRSIRPSISPKGIEIQVDGMARTANALYEFEAGLDHSQYFSSVYPVSEDSRQSKNEINFDLVMDYVPGGSTGSQPDSPTAWLPVAEPKPGGESGGAEAGATVPPGEAPGEAREVGQVGGATPPSATRIAGDQPGAAGQGQAPPEPVAQAAPLAEAQRPAATPPSGTTTPAAPQASAGLAPATAQVPAAPPPQQPQTGAPVAGTPPPQPPQTNQPVAGTPQPSAEAPPTAGGTATTDAGLQPEGASPAAATTAIEKPIIRMTIREMLQAKGEAEFIKMWGMLRPRDPSGTDANLTNEEFLEKHGMEELIKVRGKLTRLMLTKGYQGIP